MNTRNIPENQDFGKLLPINENRISRKPDFRILHPLETKLLGTMRDILGIGTLLLAIGGSGGAAISNVLNNVDGDGIQPADTPISRMTGVDRRDVYSHVDYDVGDGTHWEKIRTEVSSDGKSFHIIPETVLEGIAAPFGNVELFVLELLISALLLQRERELPIGTILEYGKQTCTIIGRKNGKIFIRYGVDGKEINIELEEKTLGRFLADKAIQSGELVLK